MAAYENVCYLIHFDEPVGGKMQHYLGFAKYLPERIAKHRAGEGAELLRVANKLGIPWRVVRVWSNADGQAEVKLKAIGAANLCPHCSKYFRGYIDTHVQGAPSVSVNQ